MVSKIKEYIRDFPEKHGSFFKIIMMGVIEISLLLVAGIIMWTQYKQIQKFKEVTVLRQQDLSRIAGSETVRNLLLKEIAEKNGVSALKIRKLLRLDPFAPVRDPDLPPEQLLNPERFAQ